MSPCWSTEHGLAKVPYLRDTRRSLGIGGYTLTYDQVKRGGKLEDPNEPVAIGLYDFDAHPLRDPVHGQSLEYGTNLWPAPPDPFQIPFRALTSMTCANLLVAGKTMAQSFLVNEATRVHPVEWASGTAAGVAAAMIAQKSNAPHSKGLVSTASFYKDHLAELQRRLAGSFTPIKWDFRAR